MSAETAAEKTIKHDSFPYVDLLERARAREGGTWGTLASRIGVSIDTLRRLRDGSSRNLPRPQTMRKIASVLAGSEGLRSQLLQWAEQLRAERNDERVQRSLRDRRTKAQCRVCSGTEPLSTVHRARSFVPATSGHPASFVHRRCAQQPRKVTLVCACGNERREYKSAQWKRRNQSRMKAPGEYAVPCRRCNVSLQGKRQTGRMRRELFRRFAQLFAASAYRDRYKPRIIWERAREGDPKAERIRQEVLASGYRSAWSERRKRGVPAPQRGARVSQGQLLRRWPSTLKGLGLCRLCWLLVHGRKYHPECWKAWMRSSEFQQERERRRWSSDKPGRLPIDPPVPPFRGRPSTRLQEKYTWFMEKLAGVSVTQIARDAGVAKATVSIGIDDFKRRLPGSWRLVFRNGTASATHHREVLFPLDNVRAEGRGPLLKWLARYGMPAEKMSELVGYSVGQIQGILAGFISQGIAEGLPGSSPSRTPRSPEATASRLVTVDGTEASAQILPNLGCGPQDGIQRAEELQVDLHPVAPSVS
jgi:transcriptional regulator with XRE-family HTH domain